MARVMVGALLLSFGLGAFGCRKAPSAKPAPKPVASRRVAAAGSATPAKPAASVDPRTRQRELDEARARWVAYRKALGEGRGATKAGKYAAAAKAFSAALEAQPDDARAYAERGYAAFLAKDYESAQADLDRAAEGADDRLLRAQTFFNLGLVREALGADATSAFALSNYLHATGAAKNKLEGKSTCPIEVARGPEAPQETRYADSLAFLADARDTFKNIEGLELGTNAAVKTAMCFGETCAGAGPWIALGLGEVFLVRPLAAGIAVTSLAISQRTAYCEPDNDAELVQTSNSALVVRARRTSLSPARFCSDDTHPEHGCTTAEELDIEQNPATQLQWIQGCYSQHYTSYEVFDRAKETWTLRVTQLDDTSSALKDAEKVQMTLDARGIVVTGPGCHAVFPLPPGG